MSRFISLDFLCEVPDCRFELRREIIERAEEAHPRVCPECGGAMRKAYLTFAGITNATHVDGAYRNGFKDLKEAADLEVKLHKLRPEKRGEVQAEINKLRSVKK